MNQCPIISVIVPVFNCELYLSRCLRSILNQSLSYDQYEVIVINDCSTDKTEFISNLFKEDIKLISFDCNKGLPAALNAGIKQAKGKYIVRLDADDFVNKDYLKILSMFLELNHDLDAVSCDYLLVDDKENVIKTCNAEEEPIGCAIMFRNDQLIDIGLYDESFFINEEVDFRKRFLTKHSIYRLPIPLYRYRRHDGNMTNDLERKAMFDNKITSKYEDASSLLSPINWSGRSQKYSESELKIIVDVANNADPLTQGKYQTAFEKDFESYMNADGHAFAVSSATAAIELSAILCKFNPGDEIIIPAHTFVASAISFARLGCKIKWADIDLETRVVSVDSVKKLITPKTKAIMAVHLYGNAAPVDELKEIAESHNLILIEDVAQALGGEINGKKLGTFGDFSCFSFHSHKNITTLGEGGILWVNNPQIAKMVPGLRHNGLRPFEDQECYWKPAMSNVDFDIDGVWPYNFCLGEVPCALGSALLKRNDEIVKKRTERSLKFIESFNEFPELMFQKITQNSKHSWHLMAALYDGSKFGKHRDDLIHFLFNIYKVKTVVQYCPLYRYPIFIKSKMSDAECPNTDLFFDNMISFPFHEWMAETDFEEMIIRIKQALTNLRG